MRNTNSSRLRAHYTWLVGTLLLVTAWLLPPLAPAHANHTADPTSVVIAGDFQEELGCETDWQPDCTLTRLTYAAEDDVWQGNFTLPAGNWAYKAALDDGWDENYGADAQADGPEIPLLLAEPTDVKFYYDPKSHWVADDLNSLIVTAPGSFQSGLGCGRDWDPGCLRAWLIDPDGDGIYSFTTDAIPAGDHMVKAALGESWDEDYGVGGVLDGVNIRFSVPEGSPRLTFTYDPSSHILGISGGVHGQDNNVEYFGLGHNSHASLYRVPFGAITPGTELILRFRTYHADVTGVKVRFWDSTANGQFFQDMRLAASGVSCLVGGPAQPDERCDFWETTYTPAIPTTLYYRFIVNDGPTVAYYDDDKFQDGGWGEATPFLQDESYAVTVYDPAFEVVPWMQNAVVYQIFPDRFRDGRAANDPDQDEPRYGYPDDPLYQIINLSWGDLPEGHCRRYVDATPACTEQPRNRDYYGGDLPGLVERLDYLEDLGVTAIYLNPIFEAASNHAYDTQDYYTIDHFFGSNADFDALVEAAHERGIKIILDGVFNHVSSDSPYFDRYGHFDAVGACESLDSPYRDWFFFRPQAGGPCAGPEGPNTTTYQAWFGFDSLPVLDKEQPGVQDLVYAADDAVARHWLERGADGWRLDVMGDASFPADFWPGFRAAVKETSPEAIIVGELWKKHETLPKVHGDQADTTMNYRFRNAILGFFGTVDDKGFADDGESNQSPSRFALKLTSVREDYPDATYYTLWNIMDSHDTQRILWSLTPGANNPQAKETDAEDVARGVALLRLARVVQMTIPGAPTIYYGDEVGLNGDDDPDNRRPFPWDGDGAFGAGGDPDLRADYRALIKLRREQPVFRQGEMTFLLTDDEHRTLAYLLRTEDQAALVAINRHPEITQTLTIDISGRLPADIQLFDALATLPDVSAEDGLLTFSLPPLSGAVWLPAPGQPALAHAGGPADLTTPDPPTGLSVVEGDGENSLSWSSVGDAASYVVYRSPVRGGGYLPVAEVQKAAYTDADLSNGVRYYYVVHAVDAAGNQGAASNEVSALPHYAIGWADLAGPPSLEHTISVTHRTEEVFGQVWIEDATDREGATDGLRAQLGFGPPGSDPVDNPDWTWVEAGFNANDGENDEFVASLLPEVVGTYNYLYRYTTTDGRDWLYADLDGSVPAGTAPPNPGVLSVLPSDDTTPPAVPAGLTVVSASTAGVELAWDPIGEDPTTLHGYEVRRAETSGGPYTSLATVTDAAGYIDTVVDERATYYYVVRAVDTSFNRSPDSDEVQATPGVRVVTVTFNVTVPDHTPEGSLLYLAGTLDRMDGTLPLWDPGGLVMKQVDDTWTITLKGQEGTELEYKYTLGTWDLVMKGADCEELDNLKLTLDYGQDGRQVVEDVVLNWRNIEPCGD